LPPRVSTSERRIALVIGNAAYPEQPLRNPRHDASDMVTALQEVGFVVSPVYDGDKRTMLEAIRAFRQQVRPGDVALFYYAGHGVQEGGENYRLLSRDRQSSEQFAGLTRRYDEMQAECTLVPFAIADTSQEEAL